MIRYRLVEHSIATDTDIDIANVVSGRLDLAQPPLVSAWGRKPG